MQKHLAAKADYQIERLTYMGTYSTAQISLVIRTLGDESNERDLIVQDTSPRLRRKLKLSKIAHFGRYAGADRHPISGGFKQK